MSLVRRFRGPLRPLGLVFTAYEVWRRLPPEHRQRLVGVARRHGPRVASSLVNRRLKAKKL
jgi:hypothetical protein